MQLVSGMFIATILIGIGFYAGQSCQPQMIAPTQIASINDGPDAFAHLMQRLTPKIKGTRQ